MFNFYWFSQLSCGTSQAYLKNCYHEFDEYPKVFVHNMAVYNHYSFIIYVYIYMNENSLSSIQTHELSHL